MITLESKDAGGDASAPSVRAAVLRAKEANMPATNIERAIARGTQSDAASMEAVAYEAYGPGGTALMIEGITDNKNRTTPEIKHLLSQYDTTLAEQGAASWAFKRAGDRWVPQSTITLEQEDKEKLENLLTALLDHDDVQTVFTNAS